VVYFLTDGEMLPRTDFAPFNDSRNITTTARSTPTQKRRGRASRGVLRRRRIFVRSDGNDSQRRRVAGLYDDWSLYDGRASRHVQFQTEKR